MRKTWYIIAPFIGVAVIALWVLFGGSKIEDPIRESPAGEMLDTKIEYFYGIPVDSFEIIKGKVRRNQMLGNILHDYGVTDRQVYEVSLLPREDFDVRRIKAGNDYTVFLDSLGLRYFVYEKDKVNFAVIHFGDSIHVDNLEKPVERITSAVSGEIRSSLWETFLDLGVNPMLAVELSDVYQWSIDFFGLQVGDKFKVVYDESYVDSSSVGISKIHSAWFFHAGHEFWAIPFEQDSVVSFFDEEGNSLRKAFLKAPLRYSRISSGYSNSRLHPILKIRRPHHGVDYAAPTGTPVEAVGDGKIIAAAWERGGGNYIKIRHNSIYTTVYMHLRSFAKGLHTGMYVKQGDVIGYVGSTGLATGPHLDFRFYKNGYAINPLKVKAPPVKPVHKENLEDYDLVKRSVMAELQAIP